MTPTLEPRAYAMHRIGPGDWLAFSNDLATRYRIHSYTDGRIHGLDVNYQARTFWRVAKMPATRITADLACGDPWNPAWEEVDWMLPTRRAALEAVGLGEPNDAVLR